MNKQDLSNLSQKTREDGKRLFGVCETIYKISIVFIWIFGIFGAIASIVMMRFSVPIAIGVGLLVICICFISYMIAVLSTHVGKVMVHTSYATLGLLEYFSGVESTVKEGLSNISKDSNSDDDKIKYGNVEIQSVLDKNDPNYIEGAKLAKFLSSNGYECVQYEQKTKLWVMRGGTAEFECNLDQLRDLARNFS